MLRDFTQEQFDIIIQAGQSNSDGFGTGEVGFLEQYFPNENVWQLNNDFTNNVFKFEKFTNDKFTISMAQERAGGAYSNSSASLFFAREYVNSGRLENGRKILIVRAAVGATGFVDGRWKVGDELYGKMIDMTKTALDLNSGNRLTVMLWHQGESDAGWGADYETHYKNLSTMLTTYRETFNCVNLPVVTADFVQEWKEKNIEKAGPISNAVRDVCSNIGRAKFIETDGLLPNKYVTAGSEDDIHFSRKALMELGKKYFEAFCEITGENAE